ncbi:metallophosphoesterase family protein [Fictibacillus sp. NRS-1165]|uniref:metallophosphoesterase family protein n=1 Tax=Fictibacillus sp. NRS-1165 TaxID=3144463 RepID=UPI003D217A24
MRIVVISDTHMPKKSKKLPGRLLADLKTADLIVHAGDWETPELFSQLQFYAPVKGVTGNVDDPELKDILSEKIMFDFKGFTFGVVHGHGKRQTTEKRAISAFSDESVDCIIFGHSHIPKLYHRNGVLMFNPGSPTDKRREKYFSHGIITIDQVLHAQHVFYSDKN